MSFKISVPISAAMLVSLIPERLPGFLFGIDSRDTDVFQHEVGEAGKLSASSPVHMPSADSMDQAVFNGFTVGNVFGCLSRGGSG